MRTGQTGSLKEGAKAGGAAGVFSAVTGVVGEALRSARVPEWFQSKVFHNSTDDMLQELKTVGEANIKKTDPELYKRLTDAGILRIDKTGNTVINETLAKEALDRGLKGSIKNMANSVVKTARESELAARAVAQGHNVPIKIEPQYARLLKEVSEDYADVGFGEISQKATELATKVQAGETDAMTALDLRRFLDGMRSRASFAPATKLTQTQQNFKTLSDNLRQRLASEVPGMKGIMNEYRFSLEALQALAKEGNRRGNREAFNLLDSFLFGSGMASGNPITGAGLSVTRRVLNSPRGTTGIAQRINKLGTGTSKTGKLIRTGAAILASPNKK